MTDEVFEVVPVAHVIGGRSEPTDDHRGGTETIIGIDDPQNYSPWSKASDRGAKMWSQTAWPSPHEPSAGSIPNDNFAPHEPEPVGPPWEDTGGDNVIHAP